MAAQSASRNKKGIAASLILASAAAMAFLHTWEEGPQRRLTVYADRLAGGLPTVCMGLTRHITTTPIIVGETWSETKCEREERAAVEKVQRQLLRCFELPPVQSVFDAATSHAWNFGAPSTCASSAMQAWNRGYWRLGCERIARASDGRRIWSYVRTGRRLPNGKPEMRFVQGLANRRDAEVRLCLEDL